MSLSQLNGKTYLIRTFGCQMNMHDSERVSGLLDSCGCMEVATPEEADIVVFMTCCVREAADTRLYGQCLSCKSLPAPPSGKRVIAVGGCIAQRDGEGLLTNLDNVDVVFGTHSIAHVGDLIAQAFDDGNHHVRCEEREENPATTMPWHRATSYHAWVPIMTGCNNFCSYCIVPYVRGRERSRSVESIVNEVKDLAANGVKEITLLGQNVNSYYSEDDNADFPALLRAVCKVDGIERVRFMTSHPKDLSDGLIAAMAEEEKACPHIHLPVQSGSDRILKLMNRHYDRERYFTVVDKLKAAVPGVELTTDIIVGFPGETEEDFEATLDMVKKIGYSAAYTFKYSPRTGTKAATMDEQISEEVKKERLKRLNDTVAKGLKAGSEKYIGQEGEVLVEGCDHRGEPMAYGKLPCFKMVYFKGDEGMIGSLRRVKITGITKNSLVGELI